MHTMPKEQMKEIPEPSRSLPRRRVRLLISRGLPRKPNRYGGSSLTARLTDHSLGNRGNMPGLAKVVWDGPTLKVTNLRISAGG
jgi:hypothetical protein